MIHIGYDAQGFRLVTRLSGFILVSMPLFGMLKDSQQLSVAGMLRDLKKKGFFQPHECSRICFIVLGIQKDSLNLFFGIPAMLKCQRYTTKTNPI